MTRLANQIEFSLVICSVLLVSMFNLLVPSAAAQVTTLAPTSPVQFEQPTDVCHSSTGLPVYCGTVGQFQDSLVLACLGLDGSYQWRKSYDLGLSTTPYAILQDDTGYTVVGQSNARIFLFRSSLTGDSLWTKYYGQQGMQFTPYRAMVLNNRLVICGRVKDSSIGYPNSDGFILQTGLNGDSLNYFHHSAEDSVSLSFVGLHTDVAGNVGAIGWQTSNNQDFYAQVFGAAPDFDLLWASMDERPFLPMYGAITEGEYVRSDSVSVHYVHWSELFEPTLIQVSVTAQGEMRTDLNHAGWLSDRPDLTLGHISYGQMDVILGYNSPVAAGPGRHFLLATDRQGEIFWSYETDSSTIGGFGVPIGMALDSIKGILFVANSAFDGTDINPNILRVDLTQLQSLMSVSEQQNEKAALIYPNPADEYLQINWDKVTLGCQGVIEFHRADGSLVQHVEIDHGLTTIRMGHLSEGLYLLTLTDCKGNRATEQLLRLKR